MMSRRAFCTVIAALGNLAQFKPDFFFSHCQKCKDDKAKLMSKFRWEFCVIPVWLMREEHMQHDHINIEHVRNLLMG